MCFPHPKFKIFSSHFRQELLDGLAGGVVEVHGVCMHENQDDGDTLHLGGDRARSRTATAARAASVELTVFSRGKCWRALSLSWRNTWPIWMKWKNLAMVHVSLQKNIRRTNVKKCEVFWVVEFHAKGILMNYSIL